MYLHCLSTNARVRRRQVPYHLKHLDGKLYVRTYISYLLLYVVVLALK